MGSEGRSLFFQRRLSLKAAASVQLTRTFPFLLFHLPFTRDLELRGLSKLIVDFVLLVVGGAGWCAAQCTNYMKKD